MKSLSIKWRISLWISAVITAIITIISIVASIEFKESHLRNLDQTIMTTAEGIIANIDNISDRNKWAEEVNIVTGNSDGNSPFFYRIWLDGSSSDLLTGQSNESEQGRWLHELSVQKKPEIEGFRFINTGIPEKEYRVVWLRHKINGDVVNIALGSSSHFTYNELYEFINILVIFGLSLVIASFIATIWTVRCNLLVPVNIVAKRLHDTANPNIKEIDFSDIKVAIELKPFVKALNDMLGRLNMVLQQQKQFTSDAAHELRTPLSLAKSTLQASQLQTRQTDEYRQTIEDALQDIARMEYLIEQFLVLARLDEVKCDVVTSEVELDVLLRELSETYGKKMERTGGKVIFEESPNITINGNIDELIRLFSNILDNAAKYGPPNGTIRLSLKRELDDYIKVCIHDEGGNIPKEALSHLFNRFYRIDSSRSKKTGGAGLGLAIAREIVRRHNGDISITSSPESGTIVSIRLALAQQG